MGKYIGKIINMVNPNSKLRHSRHLLVHLQIPKHHQLSNKQQRLFLLLETKNKTALFCITKITSRMRQASQIMTTYSLVMQQEKNYIIPTISAPNHHTQLVATTSSIILNSNTPTILPMCFKKDGKTAQAAKCIKSTIITKVIDYIFLIDTFEQQRVILKGMLN